MVDLTVVIPSMVEVIHNIEQEEHSSPFEERPTMLISDESERPSMISEHPIKNNALDERPTMLRSDSANSLSERPYMLSEHSSIKSDSPCRIPSGSEEKLGRSDGDSSSNIEDKSNKPPMKRGKRKKYQKYTPEDRYAIGKYCFENGPAAARKAFQDRYPEMSESVTRGFRDKYKQIIGESAVYEFEQKRQREYAKRTGPLPRGRPRKYRPVEDEEISASMVARNLSPPDLEVPYHVRTPPSIVNGEGRIASHSPQTNNGNHQSTSPSLLNSHSPQAEKNYEREPREQYTETYTKREERRNSAFVQYFNRKDENSLKSLHVHPFRRKETEVSIDEMFKIGKMCSQDGIEMTLRKIQHDFPNLKVEDIRVFHKKYLEMKRTKGNMASSTMQPQVFILENENHKDSTSEGPNNHEIRHIERRQQKNKMHPSEARYYKELSMQDRSRYTFYDERQIHLSSPPRTHNIEVIPSQTDSVHRMDANNIPSHTDSVHRMDANNRKVISPLETTDYLALERHKYLLPSEHYGSEYHDSYYKQQRLGEEYYRRDPYTLKSPSHSPARGSPPSVSRPSTSIQVSTVVSKQAAHQTIIHYPKPSSSEHSCNEEEVKRSYSTAFETSDYGSYPYDNLSYERSPPNESNSSQSRSKRFKYQKYTPEDRYNIGKLCNEIGLGATVKVYREQFPRLNESVVRTFRNKYRELIEKGNGEPHVEAIERKPSRRSISSLIEHEVVSQLRQFKISKIELSENLVLAVGENIVASKDPREIVALRSMLTKDWAVSLLWKHKLVEKPKPDISDIGCERCQTKMICPKCN